MTGGCDKLGTYDWLAQMPLAPGQSYPFVEVSFKQGGRKDFFRNPGQLSLGTGDMVAVETDAGMDVGKVSLAGELAKRQMQKKNFDPAKRKGALKKIIRKARENDIEKMIEAREMEEKTMLRARQIAGELKLDMKIGDVEYQSDKRKATFYYTSENRVDFRELIRSFSKEFHIKVEMRQIGSRQEAGKIGGIGSCGRELCCSTWLSDFKSVSTSAARYQNLAINPTKLSGQCGRLKCCLNYELDTYLDAMKVFPKKSKKIQTERGEAVLQKTDVFRSLMYYAYPESASLYALEPEKVKELLALNEKGEKGPDLGEVQMPEELKEVEVTSFVEEANVSLRTLERSSRKRRKKQGGRSGDKSGNKQNTKGSRGGSQKQERSGETRSKSKDSRGRGRNNNRRSDDQRNSGQKTRTTDRKDSKQGRKPRNQSGRPKSDKPQNSQNRNADSRSAQSNNSNQKGSNSGGSRSRGRNSRNRRKGGNGPKPNDNKPKQD